MRQVQHIHWKPNQAFHSMTQYIDSTRFNALCICWRTSLIGFGIASGIELWCSAWMCAVLLVVYLAWIKLAQITWRNLIDIIPSMLFIGAIQFDRMCLKRVPRNKQRCCSEHVCIVKTQVACCNSNRKILSHYRIYCVYFQYCVL